MSHRGKIAVIGLDYVGLPVAAVFARVGSAVVGVAGLALDVKKLGRGSQPAGVELWRL
jgi:UDP-N-acetyl-D-glucosamine/UDP-N-acetyl-D-galactosamine dehydrogenase